MFAVDSNDIERILMSLADLHKKVDHLTNMVHGQQIVPELLPLPNGIKLPLTSQAQVDELEALLQGNAELKKELVSLICQTISDNYSTPAILL